MGGVPLAAPYESRESNRALFGRFWPDCWVWPPRLFARVGDLGRRLSISPSKGRMSRASCFGGSIIGYAAESKAMVSGGESCGEAVTQPRRGGTDGGEAALAETGLRCRRRVPRQKDSIKVYRYGGNRGSLGAVVSETKPAQETFATHLQCPPRASRPCQHCSARSACRCCAGQSP